MLYATYEEECSALGCAATIRKGDRVAITVRGYVHVDCAAPVPAVGSRGGA